jgi:SAM-dependent methyltransferase
VEVRSNEGGFSWSELARRDPLAAVLDPADTLGVKNRLIDRVHKRSLRGAGGAVSGKQILDFGCGTGRVTEWLVSRGGSVTGVDITPEMVDVARRRAPSANIVLLDGTKLPFSHEHFELLVSVYVLQYYVHGERTLPLELSRVLRPGGQLLAIEQVADEEIGRGGSLAEYEAMFSDAGLCVTKTELIRLGDSAVMRTASRHPAFERLPGLTDVIRWGARRQRDVPLTGGRYADALFVVRKPSRSPGLTTQTP